MSIRTLLEHGFQSGHPLTAIRTPLFMSKITAAMCFFSLVKAISGPLGLFSKASARPGVYTQPVRRSFAGSNCVGPVQLSFLPVRVTGSNFTSTRTSSLPQ